MLKALGRGRKPCTGCGRKIEAKESRLEIHDCILSLSGDIQKLLLARYCSLCRREFHRKASGE